MATFFASLVGIIFWTGLFLACCLVACIPLLFVIAGPTLIFKK